jgi:hypothetical protein
MGDSYISSALPSVYDADDGESPILGVYIKMDAVLLKFLARTLFYLAPGSEEAL